MAIIIPQKTKPETTEVLETMLFNFTECRNADPVKRASEFQFKVRVGEIDADGTYYDSDNPTTVLSVGETNLMLADEVTLASGKKVTGADVAEALSIVKDYVRQGKYKIEPVIVDEPI